MIDKVRRWARNSPLLVYRSRMISRTGNRIDFTSMIMIMTQLHSTHGDHLEPFKNRQFFFGWSQKGTSERSKVCRGFDTKATFCCRGGQGHLTRTWEWPLGAESCPPYTTSKVTRNPGLQLQGKGFCQQHERAWKQIPYQSFQIRMQPRKRERE